MKTWDGSSCFTPKPVSVLKIASLSPLRAPKQTLSLSRVFRPHFPPVNLRKYKVPVSVAFHTAFTHALQPQCFSTQSAVACSEAHPAPPFVLRVYVSHVRTLPFSSGWEMGPKTLLSATGSIHGSVFPSLKRNSPQPPRQTACVAPRERVTLKKLKKAQPTSSKKAQKSSKILKNPQKTSINLKKTSISKSQAGTRTFWPCPAFCPAGHTRSSQTTLNPPPLKTLPPRRLQRGNPAER